MTLRMAVIEWPGMQISYSRYIHNPPIVWLDTNIVNDITDAIYSNDRLNPDVKQRFRDLHDLLQKKVNEGKIVCPFLGQRSEYIDGKVADKSDDILLNLNRGFQISGWQLDQVHIKRMMKLFLASESEFSFSDRDLTYYERNEEESDSPIQVIFLRERSERLRRNKLYEDLKRRKQEVKNLDFTTVYRQEYLGRLQALKISVTKVCELYGRFTTNFTEGESYYYHLYPYIAWKELKGIDEVHITDLKSFFESEHFNSLPIDRISSTIVTHLLTEGKDVKYTDIADLQHLPLILPYASYILTENRMAHIISAHKLDTEFGTKVFRWNETEKFLSDLEQQLP